MRKLLLLVVAFTAGVLTLAWINSRPERRSSPRRSSPGPSPPRDSPRRQGSGSGSPTTAQGDETPSSEPRRCAGTTASGKRCSREAREGSRFCWQHG